MSVTDSADELTICATDRELRRHFGKPSAAGWREGVIPATRTDEAAPTWQALERLTIARCACTASRQILDDWRNWTPSDQHLHASTGFAECSKVGYISTETGGRKDNEYYIHTSRTDDTIIQHKVIRDVNLI